MKRGLALAGLVLVAAVAVATVERLNEGRKYRQLLATGEQALSEGRNYVAIEAFSGALALRPASAVAYYHRGEAYGAQAQWQSAVRDLREARRLAPDAPQPLEALGRLFDRRGEYREAAAWYAEAASLLSDTAPPLLYSLALARYRAGNPAGALEPLRRAISADPSLAHAHYLLGIVYRDGQKFEEAAAELQQAIRLSPAFLAPREELADMFRSLGRQQEEREQLSALLVADPRPSRRIDLAMADLRAGRYDDALADLASAEPPAATDSRVALARGRIYLARAERLGDRASAELATETLESAIAGTARRSEGLGLYGRALDLAGRTAAAERLLLEATATSPVSREAFGYLADAAERLQHPAVAWRALQALDAIDGDAVTPAVRATRTARLGRLALAAGDARSAVRYLVRAIDAGQSGPEILGVLARARWTSGDRDGARTALAQALAQAPDDPGLLRLSRQFR